VQSPETGRSVTKGEECGVIESVKAAADVYAPLSGEIVAVNAELADTPEKINQDPYAAWLFRIKPSDAGELKSLLDPAAYEKIAATDQ
jgi:glycine cleavage system H protein